jgi:hypothetical protein
MAIKSSNKNTKEKIEPPHNGGGNGLAMKFKFRVKV